MEQRAERPRAAPTVLLSKKAKTLLRVSFLATLAEAMFVPMYTAFTEKVGGSILDAGVAFAVFSVATGTVVMAVGTRDRFQHGVKGFLILGFVLSALCDFGYLLVEN